MDRLREIVQNGKHILIYNLSGIKTNKVLEENVTAFKGVIKKYGEKSVYTITDISGILYDTKTKRIFAEWMKENEEYVIFGYVCGVDGIKRIMVNSVLKMSNRKNVAIAGSEEEAIEAILHME